MGPRVYAVRTGDRYGPEFEDYIDSKVPNVTWIREETIGKHQWNKLIPMSLDIDEPVCVIDIDVSFINDYMDLFNYPIERGQFVATQSWYKDTEVEGYKLQGGFQKYYPKDCKYIYDKFVSDPEYWMEYYIKNGTTCGPVNGEQYFVEDSVKEKLDLKFVPAEWMTRWENLSYHDSEWLTDANIHYPGEYLYLGGEFNPDVRLLHFQGLHKPHSIIREVRGW
jgi:hypothetical protein